MFHANRRLAQFLEDEALRLERTASLLARGRVWLRDEHVLAPADGLVPPSSEQYAMAVPRRGGCRRRATLVGRVRSPSVSVIHCQLFVLRRTGKANDNVSVALTGAATLQAFFGLGHRVGAPKEEGDLR